MLIRRPNWIALCMGIPFLGGGLLVGYLGFHSILESIRMRTWKEVPARILSCELNSHRGSKGSVTYSVAAEYEYQFAGQVHRSTRVSLHGGSDNIGSFHQDAAEELQDYRKHNEPFPAYVNPLNPSEAMLYRDVRWGMLAFQGVFLVFFGGAGLLMIVFSFSKPGTLPLKKAAAPRKRRPGRA
ncbi:MAG: DUF3592 domain-containing protein [Bryobacteraceae bacterium]|nr:DUF3592 domain-containing protein [Bryobacteraceae bacterium]